MTTESPAPEAFGAFERRLADTLAARARTVAPPGDGLLRIRRRVDHRRRTRRATWFAAAAAVVLLAGVVGIVLRSSETDSAPYVDVDTGGTGAAGPIRTPDEMAADWDHPQLLVPDDAQWRVDEYEPWGRYTVDAVVEDDSGPRHVSLTVEANGSLDVVAEAWPDERRTTVAGGDAVLTATRDSSSVLWHPSPDLTARLRDLTEGDTSRAAIEQQYQQAVQAWLEAGSIGDPPVPSYGSSGSDPIPVDDATAARLARIAATLTSVDRETWMRAVDTDQVVFVTGAGPEGPVAAPLASSSEGGTPRIALPDGSGRTRPRLTPNLAATTYAFDVDGYPEGTFELDVSIHHPSTDGVRDWEPVQVQTQSGIGGGGDALTPIFTPATVRGTAGEFEHYSFTTLERTDPARRRTLRWVSDGYRWVLRFGGAASGADAIAFADALIRPDEARWESLVFPGTPPPGERIVVFEQEWLRVTGREEPCTFGEVCD